MAITKIGVYRNPPEDMTDFEAISDLLMAYARDLGGQGMILTEWTNASGWPKLAMGSYIFHGGASYLVDTEDYEIGAPGNGTHYLRIAASGETLTVSWISSLSGYVWNPIYNGLYHADQSQILPYQLMVAGASREKWKITNLAQGGGFTTVDYLGNVQGVNNLVASGDISATGKLTGATVSAGNELLLQGKKVHIFFSSTTKSIFASPGPSITGLTFDGHDLISCDSNPATIYVHDGISSTIKYSFASPGPTITGLTFDGHDLISCNNDNDIIYVHNGISSTIKYSFASPGANPFGLTFDGHDLISCDNGTARIYVHDGISSTIKYSFASPGANPTGLTFDGTDLISCDSVTDRIYVHNGISSTTKSIFASPGPSITGLTFDGTDLISCDNNTDIIYVHASILALL